MAAAYLLGLFFVLGYAQGGLFRPEPAIIEELRSQSPSRIVAGQQAEDGQIPFQVSVRMVNAIGAVSSCGGSVIDEKWVLTAAHCLANRFTFVVRLGLTNLTRPEYIVETDLKYIHPEYDEFRAGVQTADIAMLGLKERVTFSENLKPIRIMSRAQKNNNYAGATLTVSGYGRTDDTWNGGTSSEILLWVLQRGITNEECLRWYVNSNIIKEQTICVQYYDNISQSSCQGDSGGPLTAIDYDNERTLVGVVSFGSSAGCNTAWPSGYVRPGHYHDWITEVSGIDFDWTIPESDENGDSSSSEASNSSSQEDSSSSEADSSSSQEDSSSSEEDSSSKSESSESDEPKPEDPEVPEDPESPEDPEVPEDPESPEDPEVPEDPESYYVSKVNFVN